MQKISDLVTAASHSITNQQPGLTNSTVCRERAKYDLTADAGDYINRVFNRLVTICPAWKQGIDGDPRKWAEGYKLELVAAIRDAGINKGEQIRQGIESYRMQGKAFLPAPGEFARHCIGDPAHNTAAYRVFDKSKLLPKSIPDRSKAMEHIKGMKKLITG